MDMTQAWVEADSGMGRALEHAEADSPTWAHVAYKFLERYCVRHQHFISENVSEASRTWGMVQPPTDRAWGMIYRRAIKNGLITQDGYARSARRHASICPRWQSRVFRAS